MNECKNFRNTPAGRSPTDRPAETSIDRSTERRPEKRRAPGAQDARKLARLGGTVDTLIDDIGGVEKVARALGVHATTVRRWKRGATPIPKASLRALYSLSQWGRQERHVMTVNHKRTLQALVESLQREVAEWRARCARLIEIGDFGSANAPDVRDIIAITRRPQGVAPTEAKQKTA